MDFSLMQHHLTLEQLHLLQSSVYHMDFSVTTAAGTSLDRLVRDIKDKVKTAKDFWIQLPYSVCNDDDIAAQPDNDDECWNGQDRARFVSNF
jgi:hypothetical protein